MSSNESYLESVIGQLPERNDLVGEAAIIVSQIICNHLVYGPGPSRRPFLPDVPCLKSDLLLSATLRNASGHVATLVDIKDPERPDTDIPWVDLSIYGSDAKDSPLSTMTVQSRPLPPNVLGYDNLPLPKEQIVPALRDLQYYSEQLDIGNTL